MQLSDILKESDIKKISQKTNISKQNIEILMNEEFSRLTKAKALGFISILERDYQVDLKILRERALGYFEKHGNEEERMMFTLPEKDETSAPPNRGLILPFLFMMAVVVLLWYAVSTYYPDIYTKALDFTQNSIHESVVTDIKKAENSDVDR